MCSGWGDLLTSYNGTTITYDALGNPLSYYGNRSFTWEGRQMSSATLSSGIITLKYNDNGTRVTKTKGGVTTTYYYEGTLLIAEQNANETIIYIYDDYGSVIGMQYRLTTYAEDVWDVYWFERNLQGDIVAVYNTTGTKLISYTYDAWGNFTTTYYNNGASTTAIKNPFRYRGYYYDSDLQLYYLQTRYYDSVTGRFISADDISYLGANGDLNSFNLYAYCSNNPIMYTDPSGHFIVSSLLIGFAIGAVLGFGITMYADYEDDGEVFNGSIDAGAYVANSLMGGVAGAGVAYIAPAVSTFFTTTYTLGTFTVAGEAVAVTVSGAEIASAAVGVGASLSFFSKRSKKEMSSDKPSWVNPDMVDRNLSAQQNARNILNHKYGSGAWKQGPGTEYNQIVKWIIRKLFWGS